MTAIKSFTTQYFNKKYDNKVDLASEQILATNKANNGQKSQHFKAQNQYKKHKIYVTTNLIWYYNNFHIRYFGRK